MENSIAVANHFVGKALEENIELTPMKLVKLVYIAHGWHLALKDVELLSENIQAWQYGPVVPNVYQKFRHYGSGRIAAREQVEEVSVGDNGITINRYEPTLKDSSVIPLLNKVWEVYKGYSGIQLSTLTHQKNTPWDITYNELGGKDIKSFPIPTDLIKSHYISLSNGRT